jgi:predicted metal-dependent HD superfamily phosphohydrolase
LGSEPTRYQLYTQQIRKEYSIYPDFVYKSGRKKAMFSFLEREKIYHFYPEENEKQARENINHEIVNHL